MNPVCGRWAVIRGRGSPRGSVDPGLACATRCRRVPLVSTQAMRAGPLDGLPRARPVADAPVDALVAAAEDVAKAWVLELVAGAPLSAAGELPLGELAREAP